MGDYARRTISLISDPDACREEVSEQPQERPDQRLSGRILSTSLPMMPFPPLVHMPSLPISVDTRGENQEKDVTDMAENTAFLPICDTSDVAIGSFHQDDIALTSELQVGRPSYRHQNIPDPVGFCVV